MKFGVRMPCIEGMGEAAVGMSADRPGLVVSIAGRVAQATGSRYSSFRNPQIQIEGTFALLRSVEGPVGLSTLSVRNASMPTLFSFQCVCEPKREPMIFSA
jgi:hypothetical protein